MPQSLSQEPKNLFYKLRAWSVHLYTATGLICALLCVVELFQKQLGLAIFYAALAMAVDGTDGILARKWDVRRWASAFDGRKLDDITDFLNYTFVPVLFMYLYDILPGYWIAALFFVLLASAYGFCYEHAKTDDGFFTGFPSYWNGVALYLFWLQWPPWGAALLVIGLALMTFVPTKYISMNQTPQLRLINRALFAAWAVLLAVLLVNYDNPDLRLVYLSLIYPAFYFGASYFLHKKTQKSA